MKILIFLHNNNQDLCYMRTKYLPLVISTKLYDRVWQSKGVYLFFPPNDNTEFQKQVQTIVMTHKEFTRKPYACYCHFYSVVLNIDTFKTDGQTVQIHGPKQKLQPETVAPYTP